MIQKNTILLVLCMIAGIILVLFGRIVYTRITVNQIKFTPHEVHTILQPPKSAVQAIITHVKGIVSKQGRSDTEFHTITKTDTLAQGESLATKQGSADILVGQRVMLTLRSATQLDYLTGLPGQMVVRQPMGTIIYDISAINNLPFSVRSLGLLIQFTQPTRTTITTDTNSQTVSVVVSSGSARLAYSDANDTTQVATIQRGGSALFDYTQYTLTSE